MVDPATGAVYFTNALGDVLRYCEWTVHCVAGAFIRVTTWCVASGSISVTLKGSSGGMQRDYFGEYPVRVPVLVHTFHLP